MHSPGRVCRKMGRNINRKMRGWKHHLKMTFHSEMSGQSGAEGDGVLTFGFSTTFLPPSSLLSAHGQLQSSLTEASMGKRIEAKKPNHLLLQIFSSPFTLLSQFSYCSESHKKTVLTLFLLISLILTAKRAFSSSCPGTPLPPQKERNLSITCCHSLVQALPEHSVQMRCCTLTTEHHIHFQQDNLGEK